jgi:hypothetical protein
MTVKTGQALAVTFTTSDPTTGAAADATGTPVGTLWVDGVANGAAVTVTKPGGTTGVYKAAVTLPVLTAGQVVAIHVTATVNAIAGAGIVFQDTADTQLISEAPAAALVANNLDHLVKVAKDTDWATTVTKESLLDLLTSKDTAQTFARGTDSLEAQRDHTPVNFEDLAIVDTTGLVTANVTQIAGQTASAAAEVAFPATIGTSDYAGGAVAGVTGVTFPATVPAAGDIADAVLDEAKGAHTGFITTLAPGRPSIEGGA